VSLFWQYRHSETGLGIFCVFYKDFCNKFYSWAKILFILKEKTFSAFQK
jgi:hypothetical protein